MVDFPRCAVCRLQIAPGIDVVFRVDGRVNHAQCPPALCRTCGMEVKPSTPIRYSGPGVIHATCWEVATDGACGFCQKQFRRNSLVREVNGRKYHQTCLERMRRRLDS